MGRLIKYSNGLKVCTSCKFSCNYEDADKHFGRNSNTALKRYCKKPECAKTYHKEEYKRKVSKKTLGAAREKRLNEIRACFKKWQVLGGKFRETIETIIDKTKESE